MKPKIDDLMSLHDYLDICSMDYFIDMWNPFPTDLTYVCQCGNITSYTVSHDTVVKRISFKESDISISPRDKTYLVSTLPMNVLRRVQNRYDIYSQNEWLCIERDASELAALKKLKRKPRKKKR